MWPNSSFLPSLMSRRPDVVAAIRAAAGMVAQVFVLDQHANAAWSGQRARASRTGMHATLNLNHAANCVHYEYIITEGDAAWLSL
jgi:hypothetical protein